MDFREIRRDFLTAVRDYDAEIDQLLIDTQAEIIRAATENQNDTDAFTAAVSLIMVGFYTAFSRISVNANRVVADRYAGFVQRETVDVLERVGAPKLAKSLNDRAIKYPTLVADRFLTRQSPYDKKSFNNRIVTMKRASDQMVKKMVAIGIKKGLSVNDVARSIQHYVDPTSQAGRRFTAGNGINYKAVPLDRRLPKMAIRYNAVRLARTEIMQTYRDSAGEFYDDQPYNKGFRWVLSNSHRVKDVCDEYAKRTYRRREDVPLGHPQDMCDVQPIPVTMRELSRLVSAGAIA